MTRLGEGRSEEQPDAAEVAGAGLGDPGVSITVCPDGPLLVRGVPELLTADGATVTHQRSVVALCRCGRSRLKPLCDGSHRLNRFRDPASATQLDSVLNRARPEDAA